jgi:hypothetical protein
MEQVLQALHAPSTEVACAHLEPVHPELHVQVADAMFPAAVVDTQDAVPWALQLLQGL